MTIEAICRLSQELDPTGKGVSKAGVLGNPEAYTYYQEHSRSYQAYRRRGHHHAHRTNVPKEPQPIRIEASRDLNRARRRYLAMTKAELVERVLAAEQTYVETRDQLAQLQFKLVEMQRTKPTQRRHRR